MSNSQLDHSDYYVVTTLVNTCIMKKIERERVHHTNGEAAEHFLKTWRKFNIVAVGFQINLSEIRSTIHADLNIKTSYSWFLLSFVVAFCQIIGHRVLSKRSNWWPSHNLCSATNKFDIYFTYQYMSYFFFFYNNTCWLNRTTLLFSFSIFSYFVFKSLTNFIWL